MKHILRENAFESWSMAIEYCDEILRGKATFKYKKNFISSLHNAVELFVKQRMLDKNDPRIVKKNDLKKINSELEKEYVNSNNLNEFFLNLSSDDRKQVYSISYSNLINCSDELFEEYYEKSGDRKTKETVNDSMRLLKDLRNAETHFYIDKDDFLTEKEFEQLHNFMIVFYEVLQYYKMFPFIGKPFRQYSKLSFRHNKLENFSYENAVKQSKFVNELKENIEGKIFQCSSDSSYEISQDITFRLNDKYDDSNFESLWTYVEMMLTYDLLKWEEEFEENEFEDEEGNIISTCDKFRSYSINS